MKNFPIDVVNKIDFIFALYVTSVSCLKMLFSALFLIVSRLILVQSQLIFQDSVTNNNLFNPIPTIVNTGETLVILMKKN